MCYKGQSWKSSISMGNLAQIGARNGNTTYPLMTVISCLVKVTPATLILHAKGKMIICILQIYKRDFN